MDKQDNLLAELYERSAIIDELDGPQIEAWVSGLFPVFGPELTASQLVDYCANLKSARAALLCLGLAELTAGLDSDDLSDRAREVAESIEVEPAVHGAQIGASTITEAWGVEAPFGRSIVLGFECSVVVDTGEDEEPDTRHSILVEVGDSGELEDLQLAGPPAELLTEAAAGDDRVRVHELLVDDAVAQVVGAWPAPDDEARAFGPGVAANMAFVRRRVAQACGTVLPALTPSSPVVDVRRGLTDEEYRDANRAALSTLQAALGIVEPDPTNEIAKIWAGVIRGDAGELSPREREALLWLEWADWLGAGIGMSRAGAGCAVDGESCIAFVNRCPEVSSSIEKSDREYAGWAFDVALDLLQDCGAVEDGALTASGHRALGSAMLLAWGSSEDESAAAPS